MTDDGTEVGISLDKLTTPPPLAERKPLWRGPLILTGISRILMVPWYLICALASSNDLRLILTHLHRYPLRYALDMLLLAWSMWWFFLFSVLLAWLFFTRRRSFPRLMGYFSLLLLVFIACMAVHSMHYSVPSRHGHAAVHPAIVALAVGILLFLLSGMVWPIYYFFAPELRRVFTR